MWDPQHLTTLSTSTACYKDSFIFLCFVFIVCNVSFIVCVLCLFEHDVLFCVICYSSTTVGVVIMALKKH
jgi:hypothetical protein